VIVDKSMTEDTFERVEGPTPKGGVYAIAFWQDSKGQPTSKYKATHAEIVEYDAKGNGFYRTYMTLGPK
jgi:hypothetical protein